MLWERGRTVDELRESSLNVVSDNLRHQDLHQRRGHGLGADVCADPLHLLLLLPPGHLVPGHGGPVDDGGGAQGKLGPGVGAALRLEGVAGVLIGIPEAVDLGCRVVVGLTFCSGTG